MLGAKPNTFAWRSSVIREWAPLLFILLAIPLILGIVPRNYVYGFRSRRALESDEYWYPVNRLTGVLLAATGLAWMGGGAVAGMLFLGVTIVVPAIYTGWLGAQRD
jgi:hypothetical protein